MTTREQAIEAAHRWINGDRPEERWRRIGVHEFDLGWVLWAEPQEAPADAPPGARRAPAEIGPACAVVDRGTGELTHWPSVPVEEVVRLYRDKLGAGTYDPALPPAVGPGATAVLTYRDAAGEERSLFRMSAPGTGHPEVAALRELRRQGVRPEDVLAVHTDLRPCELPGGYCAAALLAELPVAAFSYSHDYGPRYDRRAAAVRALADATEEVFRSAGRPVPPRPNRVPFPRDVPAAGPERDAALGRRLAGLFGAEGVHRADADDTAASPLPEPARHTLVWAGLPVRVEGFFEVLPGLADVASHLAAAGRGARVPEHTRALLAEYVLLGTDGHALVAVQCGDGGTGTGAGTGRVWAVDPGNGTGRYLNADLSAYVRCLALLAERRPALRGLDPYAAATAVDALQRDLAALDPTVFQDPENWWAVVVEQMWDGLL
ncbi:SUKH-4 family immunity protein [Streptacidiphilus sp. ASG 303]|uniref:SUKH-4 family immunity protein n=1 Tax=Streptacidiphilus sp. ASG 303 TaxID=2896847 RepID=UPI001E3C47F1|nr:SUKH-4 family immunity protein [Streptacidiphilus sp. ASG 303]MCD0480932.1 SUKH-4 family immunity protein [Streptacidiphilus sp. ASG 303]